MSNSQNAVSELCKYQDRGQKVGESSNVMLKINSPDKKKKKKRKKEKEKKGKEGVSILNENFIPQRYASHLSK